MVDVGEKPITRRVCVARGAVRMARETLAAIAEGRTPKGDVLAVARIAGLQAAKRTAEAEAVYRKDLEAYPHNGWSMFELAQSLDAQGKKTVTVLHEGRVLAEGLLADVQNNAQVVEVYLGR